MRVILFLQVCGLGPIFRPTAPTPFGNNGKSAHAQSHAATALAVGLMTAPTPQLISTAAAQQQAPDKNAKQKKEPSAGQLAARERQKKCGVEWKEAKAANKVEKDTTWPKFWSACNKRLKSAAN